ncbi:hypothetical protein AR457_41255 [Streptomyces agglomeratus]|uniref:Uncharacterized protein n=1 Tax=Streptomyces agglomeratus TaxID=285458 RepID=A0A1E5NY13_9ACTN|nr:hypothetical protein [Streptomyces agglomeratus]OEJ21143.1 hypothetical protein AR457_41255 [Streptomyces agglomeratus]OEJ21196.1 hypothetical protein AS594_36730 [Streptomyces agglomeratus]
MAQRIEFLTPPDELIVTAQNLPFLQVEKAVFKAMPPGPHNAATRRMADNIAAFERANTPDTSN